MNNFVLDKQLKRDCHILGKWDKSLLLLMDNALLPWFILVPETHEIELYKLSYDQQLDILDKINRLSEILINDFVAKKLNIATIGNVVSQLHIHIIGRSPEDHCWPSPVWGNPERTAYTQKQLIQIANTLQKSINNQYSAYPLSIK